MSWDNNVILDLEFTPIKKCSNKAGSISREIIELAAVKVGPNGEQIDTFSRIVRPILTLRVSGFIYRMTGIGNEDIACARTLDVVLEDFVEWIGPGRTRIVTWSNCDLVQVQQECAYKGIDCGLPARWLDLQRIYPRLMGTNRKRCVALDKAAEWCGLGFDHSSAHRALYDAKVTAQLFCYMATGNCKVQRKVLDSVVRRQEHAPCTASIGTLYGGTLADLLDRLRDKEAAVVFA